MVAERFYCSLDLGSVLITLLCVLLGRVICSAVSAGRDQALERRRREAATERWARLVRKARGVRKQQRYFAFLGHLLQEHPATQAFRRRLARWL